MRIFFAGPLTDLPNPDQTKALYKKLAAATNAHGIDHYWAFLHGTDPIANPDVSPQEVYEKDTKELKKSNIMIAYVGAPSTGTGIEIEFAHTHNIPVYLLYEQGKQISRMLRGCPAVKGEIVFKNEEDALRQLDKLLMELTHKH